MLSGERRPRGRGRRVAKRVFMGDGPTRTMVDRIKAALPAPVKVALRPAVRAVAPSRAASSEESDLYSSDRLAFCDQPSPNRWTVHDPATGCEYRFFFLCGCWKSGTHWIQNILNLHPKVKMKGEYHFEHLLDGLERFTTPKWYKGSIPHAKAVANDAMENLVRRVMYVTTRRFPQVVWLGDRSPRPLREVIRGAPMYWLLRDGRDILVSWSFHWLRSEGAGAPYIRETLKKLRPEFASDPDRFRNPDYGLLGNDHWVRITARQWAGYIAHDFDAYPRLLADGTAVHKVVYEELHQRPWEGAEAIYRFLGLDPAEARPLSVETKTLPGFKKEDLNSATRKGQTGDWRNYFNDRITRIFKEEAGEALIRAGYEKDLNW